MGTLIEISCQSCDYKKDFYLGVGVMYSSLESVWAVIPFKSRQDVKSILANFTVTSTDFAHKLYHCINCKELYEKFWLKINFKTSTNEEKTYETKFKCPQCYKELKLAKEIETEEDEVKSDAELYTPFIAVLPCPKCGEEVLSSRTIGHWD
jgi:hypothetical protein